MDRTLGHTVTLLPYCGTLMDNDAGQVRLSYYSRSSIINNGKFFKYLYLYVDLDFKFLLCCEGDVINGLIIHSQKKHSRENIIAIGKRNIPGRYPSLFGCILVRFHAEFLVISLNSR